HIQSRFDEISRLMAEAFRSLGVDARVGDVPGEYCPGAHSVNARGGTKLMGVGQRIVSRAAHVGGVVVIGGAERVRAVLIRRVRGAGRSLTRCASFPKVPRRVGHPGGASAEGPTAT